MPLHTQQYLRLGKTLNNLVDDFKLNVKRHNKYNNLVFFKYDQIDSPMGEKITQECRGLILDEDNNWEVVSYPFQKFFNYGEGHAAQINWENAICFEKLDGSLISIYNYKNEWLVASNGTPDASGPVNNNESMTFADLFWQTFNNQYNLSILNPLYCYIFELTSPYNRVIVPHATPKLTLIGCRNIQTLKEININDIPVFEKPQSFPLNTIDDCIKAAKALNPIQSEGYVICDNDFNRIKVKSPGYVALSHIKDNFTNKRIIELIRTNEGQEFLSYFEQYRPIYDAIKVKYDNLVKQLETAYEEIKDIPIQKDFALKAIKTQCSAALFNVRKGESKSIKEYISNCSITILEQLLK